SGSPVPARLRVPREPWAAGRPGPAAWPAVLDAGEPGPGDPGAGKPGAVGNRAAARAVGERPAIASVRDRRAAALPVGEWPAAVGVRDGRAAALPMGQPPAAALHADELTAGRQDRLAAGPPGQGAARLGHLPGPG